VQARGQQEVALQEGAGRAEEFEKLLAHRPMTLARRHARAVCRTMV
jgi:hypothetical protein